MRHLTPSPPNSRREALLAARALELRGSLNTPQQMLWHAVAAGRLGVYFRREVVLLGRFIVDMLAPSIRLVVEVDGRCHELRRGADKRRDKALARAGYHVLRVEALVVLWELPVAVARVEGGGGATSAVSLRWQATCAGESARSPAAAG
jgi:very-short-patch-repair endonuclease